MKAVLNRKKSANAIVTASQRWAAATAQSLAELLRPELVEDETLPDLEHLQQLLGRALARNWQRVERADQAREQVAERRRRCAAEKTAACTRLYRQVVDLRRILRGVFGGAASRRLLGIAGDTSRDAVVLLRQADHAVARLSVPLDDLPPSSIQLTEDDPTRWRAPIEAAADTLRSAVTKATVGGKELEAANAELRRAIADFDPVFVRVASMLAGVYAGAERDERADAVRPSRRRLGLLLTDDRYRTRASERDGRLTPGKPLPRPRRAFGPASAGKERPRHVHPSQTRGGRARPRPTPWATLSRPGRGSGARRARCGSPGRTPRPRRCPSRARPSPAASPGRPAPA